MQDILKNAQCFVSLLFFHLCVLLIVYTIFFPHAEHYEKSTGIAMPMLTGFILAYQHTLQMYKICYLPSARIHSEGYVICFLRMSLPGS